MEHVILVDDQDDEIGTMEKMEAHQKGMLHRAFSVLLFNSKGEILLQKRSSQKYHSGGLWTNTCCSHPKPGESMEKAVRRRLKEEMGIDVQPDYVYKFLYRVKLNNYLTEHELDYVYVGHFNEKPVVNVNEVESWKYVHPALIIKDMLHNAQSYTYWFRLILHHPELAVSIPVPTL